MTSQPLSIPALALIGVALGAPAALSLTQAPAAQFAAAPERTVWYFYKVKWGFQQEFVELFTKNHLPS